MSKVYLIGEVGINGNGDLDLTKQLIKKAKDAGFDSVKFQKRDIDLVYSPEDLARLRQSPFGKTNGDLKRKLEYSDGQYNEIDAYCKELNIDWSASAWDARSVKFLQKYDLKWNKIASALLTVKPLLKAVAKQQKLTYISTGMSNVEEIWTACDIFEDYECPFIVVHTNSSYPTKLENLNLKTLDHLRSIEEDCLYCKGIGYSSHEVGYIGSVLSVAYGVKSIEAHITLDKNMFGSDQKASLDPIEFTEMVKQIRLAEKAIGDVAYDVREEEKPVREKLLKGLYWWERS